MRIADNPKIWGRKPSPEDRPEDRPKHRHEYDDMGWCKACGISSFRAHWDNEEQCPGHKQELGPSAMGNAEYLALHGHVECAKPQGPGPCDNNTAWQWLFTDVDGKEYVVNENKPFPYSFEWVHSPALWKWVLYIHRIGAIDRASPKPQPGKSCHCRIMHYMGNGPIA
jgi:hypothetical protein